MLRPRGVSFHIGWREVVWGVIVIAIVVRLWGTWYGLPFSYHKDEYHEVMRALSLGAGSFDLDRTTKGGFYFVLFFEYGIYYVVLKLSGAVASPLEFAQNFARDPTAFYLMGRMTAVVAGSFTVLLAFLLARRAYSVAAGVLAAIFLAINALHIDLSRVIGVDVPMTMLVACSLLFAWRVAEYGRTSDYLLASLFAALATTTKLPGVIVLVPLLMAHSYAIQRESGGIRAWLSKRDFWFAAAVFLVVLVATNPGILFKSGYLSLFTETAGGNGKEGVDAETAYFVRERPNLYLYYLFVVRDSMGWPLFILGLASLAFALLRRTPLDLMLVVFALINYLAISSTTSDVLYYPRYALPIIFVFAVLAGRFLDETIGFASRWRSLVTIGALMLCAGPPIAQAMVTMNALARPDTRTLAAEWFEKNVPTGSHVLIESGKITADRATVPLRDSVAALERRIAHWRLVEPKQARYLELKLATHQGGGFNLELADLDEIASIEEYSQRGIEYFVVRPAYFLASRRAGTGSAALIRDLRSDSRVTLLKRFEGDTRTQLGPTIEIYRLSRKLSSSRN